MAVSTHARYPHVHMRRRPRLEEDQAAFNATILARLAELPGVWRPDRDVTQARQEEDEVLCVDLDPVLVEAIGGRITYQPRFPLIVEKDLAMCDDWLDLTLDVEQIDYAGFCRSTLPRLVEIFGPYRMKVTTDQALDMEDWDTTSAHYRKTRRRIDGREGVYRLWPVSYVDDVLCRRAFGLAAAEVVAQLAPECERAELIGDGAFLLATTARPTGAAELDALNGRLKARLEA